MISIFSTIKMTEFEMKTNVHTPTLRDVHNLQVILKIGYGVKLSKISPL